MEPARIRLQIEETCSTEDFLLQTMDNYESGLIHCSHFYNAEKESLYF